MLHLLYQALSLLDVLGDVGSGLVAIAAAAKAGRAIVRGLRTRTAALVSDD